MNKEYFDEKENCCYNKLKDFNSNKLHLSILGETPKKHWTDASGYTAASRYLNFELKDRNQEIRQKENGEYYIHGWTEQGKEYDCDGIYIEQHKVCSMMLDYIVYGYEPIYVNFLKNGVIVYNLAKLKNRPEPFKQKIHSKGYGKMEIGTRENLNIKDATIYDLNYNILKLPE